MSAQEKSQAAELRAAYVVGSIDMYRLCMGIAFLPTNIADDVQRDAACRYPDPAEPRVVADADGYQWRYLPPDHAGEIGAFEVRPGPGQPWREAAKQPVEARMIVLWADLMLHPFQRGGVPCATAAG